MPVKKKSSKKKSTVSDRELIPSSAVHRMLDSTGISVHSKTRGKNVKIRISEEAVSLLREYYKTMFDELSVKAGLAAANSRRRTIKVKDVFLAIEVMAEHGLRKLAGYDASNSAGDDIFFVYKGGEKAPPANKHILYTAKGPLAKRMKSVQTPIRYGKSEEYLIDRVQPLAAKVAQAVVEARIIDIMTASASAATNIGKRMTIEKQDVKFVGHAGCSAGLGGQV